MTLSKLLTLATATGPTEETLAAAKEFQRLVVAATDLAMAGAGRLTLRIATGDVSRDSVRAETAKLLSLVTEVIR